VIYGCREVLAQGCVAQGIAVMTEKDRTIEIPESLFDRLTVRIKGTSYQSVSDYVANVLREKLASEEKQDSTKYTKEEEEKVKERLKALGYL
jgi:Arc/MetJ-type ribon-helix-helix transcriptional regulator